MTDNTTVSSFFLFFFEVLFFCVCGWADTTISAFRKKQPKMCPFFGNSWRTTHLQHLWGGDKDLWRKQTHELGVMGVDVFICVCININRSLGASGRVCLVCVTGNLFWHLGMPPRTWSSFVLFPWAWITLAAFTGKLSYCFKILNTLLTITVCWCEGLNRIHLPAKTFSLWLLGVCYHQRCLYILESMAGNRG